MSLRSAVLAFAASISPAFATVGDTAPFNGIPIIEDVDSFWVEGAHIRLSGVDGPEVSGRSQDAGNAATRFLYDLTRGRQIICSWNGDMTLGCFGQSLRG